MSNTTSDMVMEQVVQDPVTVIVLASVIFVSEIMGVLPIKQNGILHTIVNLLQKLVKK